MPAETTGKGRGNKYIARKGMALGGRIIRKNVFSVQRAQI